MNTATIQLILEIVKEIILIAVFVLLVYTAVKLENARKTYRILKSADCDEDGKNMELVHCKANISSHILSIVCLSAVLITEIIIRLM